MRCDFYSLYLWTLRSFSCVLFMICVLSVSEDYLIRESAAVWQVVVAFILSACSSVALSVWQSVKSDHYRRTEESDCVNSTAVVQLCPRDGPEKLWWDPSQQRDVPLSMPSACVSQKVCFHFFFFFFEMSILNGMKDTLDPVLVIKLQSVKPERRVYLSRPPKAEQRVFERILLDHLCGHKWKSGERCRRWSER